MSQGDESKPSQSTAKYPKQGKKGNKKVPEETETNDELLVSKSLLSLSLFSLPIII